jgi:hypothetical protein
LIPQLSTTGPYTSRLFGNVLGAGRSLKLRKPTVVLLSQREIFQREAELSEHLFHRDPLAAALAKPSLACVEALAVLFRDGLIIRRGSGYGASEPIHTTHPGRIFEMSL